jgi:hypothetical protein
MCGKGSQLRDTALVIPTRALTVAVYHVCACMYVCEEQPARDTGDPHKGTNSLLCPTSSAIHPPSSLRSLLGGVVMACAKKDRAETLLW